MQVDTTLFFCEAFHYFEMIFSTLEILLLLMSDVSLLGLSAIIFRVPVWSFQFLW
jgi:hypothetical protein